MKTNRKQIARRQASAAKRQHLSDNLSLREKMSRLDSRFGEGLGANKEREKLFRMFS